jgi:hypothetical protein
VSPETAALWHAAISIAFFLLGLAVGFWLGRRR